MYVREQNLAEYMGSSECSVKGGMLRVQNTGSLTAAVPLCCPHQQSTNLSLTAFIFDCTTNVDVHMAQKSKDSELSNGREHNCRRYM